MLRNHWCRFPRSIGSSTLGSFLRCQPSTYAPIAGFEPTTLALTGRCAATAPYRNRLLFKVSDLDWSREWDLNPRPVGYEPTEMTELLYPATPSLPGLRQLCNLPVLFVFQVAGVPPGCVMIPLPELVECDVLMTVFAVFVLLLLTHVPMVGVDPTLSSL